MATNGSQDQLHTATPAVPPPPPPPAAISNGSYGPVRGNPGSQLITSFQPYAANPISNVNVLPIQTLSTITPITQVTPISSVTGVASIPTMTQITPITTQSNSNDSSNTVSNTPSAVLNAAVTLNAAARLQAAAIARNRTLLSAHAQAQAQAQAQVQAAVQAAAAVAAANAQGKHDTNNNTTTNGNNNTNGVKPYETQVPLIPNQSLLQQQHPAYRHFNAAAAAAAAATVFATTRHNDSHIVGQHSDHTLTTRTTTGSRYDPFNAYGSSTKSSMINNRVKDDSSYNIDNRGNLKQKHNGANSSLSYMNGINGNINHSLNNMNNNNDKHGKKKKNKKAIATHAYQLRTAAGETWVDPTMTEWPENDFRIFCGDLGNEVSDQMLTSAFSKYASFAKAKVVRDKRTGKSKGYGFVSFLDPNDFIRAFKEMNGKYVGNRPIKLRKSKWKDRQKRVKHFKTVE